MRDKHFPLRGERDEAYEFRGATVGLISFGSAKDSPVLPSCHPVGGSKVTFTVTHILPKGKNAKIL